MDQANVRDEVIVKLGMLCNPDMTMVSITLVSDNPIPKGTLLQGLDRVKELLNDTSVVAESAPGSVQANAGAPNEEQRDISGLPVPELDRDLANQLPNG